MKPLRYVPSPLELREARRARHELAFWLACIVAVLLFSAYCWWTAL